MGQCWNVTAAEHYSTGASDQKALDNLILHIQQKGGYTDIKLNIKFHFMFIHNDKQFSEPIETKKFSNNKWSATIQSFPHLGGNGSAEIRAIADLMYKMEEDEECMNINEYRKYSINYTYNNISYRKDIKLNCNGGLWYAYVFSE
jgi:hypothetical protein